MKKYPAFTALAAATIAAFGMAIGPATADTHNFYKNKTIRVVVPSGSGGTYHIYCQLFARHFGRFLPGNPTAVTQNRPGAGGAKAARYMVSVAPKDGSVIAMINPGSTMLPLLRPGIGFETLDMQWLGAMSVRTYTIATWYTVPAKSIADLKKKQVTMGTSGKASTGYQVPAFMNATLGTKIKVILGYKSGGATNLAMERGEVDGRGNFYSGYTGVRPHWLRDKKLNFIVTLGPSRPEVKGVPVLRSLMKTDLDRAILDLLEVNFYVGQAFYVPKGVPKARVALLRKAFTAMITDPKMLADAEKRRVPMNTRTHQQTLAAITKGFQASPEAVKGLRKILGFGKKKKKKS